MAHNLLSLDDIDPQGISSGRWRKGKAPGEAGGMALPVTTVFIHHTDSADTGDVVADIAGPCDTDQGKFGKVSYSWMVHASTNSIVEVEGVCRGAHTINNDQQSLNGVAFGIGVVGNFQPDASPPPFVAPTAEHQRLIIECINELLVAPGLVAPGFDVLGHRDAPYATACCGDALYALLPEIRRLTFTGHPTDEDNMTDDEKKLLFAMVQDVQNRSLTPEQLDALVGPADGLYAALNDRTAKIETAIEQFRVDVQNQLNAIAHKLDTPKV